MPEAIATTKRKFHRLLDTLTSYANSPVHSADPIAPPTTREKLEQASERVRKRQRQDGSLSSIESRLASLNSTTSLHKSAKAAKNPPNENKNAPNFSPWSQETFLQRLHTFSRVSLWHPKPEAINEVAWAKRGWQCIDVNTVSCHGGCEKRVLVNVDIPRRAHAEEDEEYIEDREAALEQALTARYQDEIVAGHRESCLWRKSSCKDDILRLQVVRPAVWQPALKSRYSTLLSIAGSIQNVTLQESPAAKSSQLTTEQIHLGLSEEVLSASEIARDTQTRALDIAIHGWRGTSELNADLLNCDVCFQRIGLWMYQPGYHSRVVTGEDSDTSVNLVEMHREYCPWRNASSQQASGSLAGLNASEILFRVISTYLREKRRKNEEEHAAPVTPQAQSAESLIHTPKLSREEVERQDRERESRMQKIKRLLTIKRPPKSK